jgi:predicted ATPase/DNA-binding CsgD family transcriptional regulator
VLDNLEHLLEVAPRLSQLLMDCTRLVILATSRATLRLRWEHEIAVPPLDADAAQALFTLRASAVRPDLHLDASAKHAIAQICQRLDGLPLALELAAARVKLMHPRALLGLLDRRLEMLGAAPHDVPDRQRTLRAAMDWSYELLDREEQRIFRSLSVFEGGFSLEAAQAVLDLDAGYMLDQLAALVDRSLLQPAGDSAAAPRFTMLETIRAYGLDRLRAAQEHADLAQRHATYFLAMAEAAEPHLRSADQVDALARFDTDYANLRAALVDCMGQRDGLRLAGTLWRFWEVRGYLSEGRSWLERALAGCALDGSATRANALVGLATLASRQADFGHAIDLMEQALAIYGAIDDRPGIALSLQILGTQYQMQGDFARATTLHEEGLALFRELGDRRGVALSLNNLAYQLQRQGEMAAAAPLIEECVQLARLVGDTRLLAVSLYNLAGVVRHRGDVHRAAALYGEALGLFRDLADKRWIGFTLGDLSLMEEDAARALGLAQEGLALLAEVGEKLGVAQGLERVALLCVGELRDVCVRLFGVADALRAAINSPRPDDLVAAALAKARVAMGPTAFAHAWGEGRGTNVREGVRTACSLRLRAAPAAPTSVLTRRECEVAELIAQGKTNRAIAAELVLSERTVDAHVEHIRAKVGVRTRTQIATWLLR